MRFAPFFSPDGESIGFFTAAGGAHQHEGHSGNGRSRPHGGAGFRRIFSAAPIGATTARSISPTAPAAFSALPPPVASSPEISHPDSASGVKEHDFPDVLPGSKQAFVMLWKGSLGSNRVGVVDLATGAVTVLAEGSYPRYLAPDLIVIGGSEGRLLVAHFDAGKNRLTGAPELVLEDVQDEISNGTVQFALAENGTLVYQPKHGGNVGVLWVDRAGHDVPVDTIPERQLFVRHDFARWNPARPDPDTFPVAVRSG